jgi:hypothetical protein
MAAGPGCLSRLHPSAIVISFIAHQTERRVMGKRNIAFYYEKLSPEDQHTFNRWLKANAIGGAIFAIALIAMALAGSRSVGPRDAEVASSMKASGVAASEQRRRQPGVVTTQNPKMRQNCSD